MTKSNKVIKSFGEEWKRFDQSELKNSELNKILKIILIFFHGI